MRKLLAIIVCKLAAFEMCIRDRSLAIGREGQNARLAAKLTGYRIDIKPQSEAAPGGEE